MTATIETWNRGCLIHIKAMDNNKKQTNCCTCISIHLQPSCRTLWSIVNQTYLKDRSFISSMSYFRLMFNNERSTCAWNDSACLKLSKIILFWWTHAKIKAREHLFQFFQIERCEITCVSSGLWILHEIAQIILISKFLNWNFLPFNWIMLKM